MKTFFIDLLCADQVFGLETRATTMQDALIQVDAFNHLRETQWKIERISQSRTRGLKYGGWGQ
jgi:hypothetical protein